MCLKEVRMYIVMMLFCYGDTVMADNVLLFENLMITYTRYT